MKINFGSLKNKKILIGNNKKMRPTQSINKDKIFNIISISTDDIILDLFAGTGALGFESASLGAKSVYWIDNNIESTNAIEKNIDIFNLDSKYFKVFRTDFRRALKAIKIKPTIIFLDPPFIAKHYYDEALLFIKNNNVLAANGIIILEKEDKLEIKSLSQYTIKVLRKIGEKELLILKNKK